MRRHWRLATRALNWRDGVGGGTGDGVAGIGGVDSAEDIDEAADVCVRGGVGGGVMNVFAVGESWL